MRKIVEESLIKEGYGAGYSTGSFRGGMGGTTRGGFGGANNLGGPNMMYTYEIKPLNHTLEQRPTTTEVSTPEIKLGSKITGLPVRSNATPDEKKITGIIHKIAQTDEGAIKYYIIMDEATQQLVKIDPLTATLIIHEPVEYYTDPDNTTTSKRKEKIQNWHANKIVRESIK